MNGAKLGSDSLVAEQLEILRRTALWMGGYVIISTSVYAIIDIFFAEDGGLFFISSIAIWALGYILLVVLMRSSGPLGERQSGGIGGYFGLGILTGLATAIGLVLLIVPGLYLILRWLPAYARLQHKGASVTDAMRWSWNNTAPFQQPLAIALIGPAIFYMAFFGLIVWQEYNLGSWSPQAYNLSVVALNLWVSIAVAWLQLLGVAAYRVIQREHEVPLETFS